MFDMLRWYYFAAAFFVLQGMEGLGLVDQLLVGEWEGKPGDKITQSLNLLMILTSLALFGRGIGRIKSIRTGALLGIGAAGFLLCSAIWSIDPQTTVRGAIVYLTVVVGAIGVVENFKGDEFMDLFALICFLTGVASLILLVVYPAEAFGAAGDFRGIFSQKNILGEAMTMGALASLHGLRAGNRARLRGAVFLVLVTILAVMSGSATSLLVVLAFCGTDVMIGLIRKGGAARILGIGAIVVAFPLVVLEAVFPDTILEMMGKDATLTGRTEIWDAVIPYIYQRPWLGWGYGAFWSTDNPAAMQIADSLHWFAPQAHNGLLEMLLHVGVVGTAIFIFLWARTVWLSLRCMQTSEKALAITCLMSCAGLILVGISETVLVVPFEASTIVFFVTGLLCERAVWAAHVSRHYPTAVRRQRL
jgi:O-antigen ligase